MTGSEPDLYSWDITVTASRCGVTPTEWRARQALASALLHSPIGAEGIVRAAVLTAAGEYAYTDPIVTGRHAPDGTVVWQEAAVPVGVEP